MNTQSTQRCKILPTAEKSLSRRNFISGLSAFGLCSTPLFSANSSNANEKIEDADATYYWVSAEGDTEESYGLRWVNSATGQSKKKSVGYRGHDTIQHPQKANTTLMFARRPGTEAVEINLQDASSKMAFRCSKNRHLLGHGCFSNDGAVLFTTESDYISAAGKIGVRDANTYQLIEEYDSFGIGPHQLKLLPDGKTLVIANGGIQTHPDTGREKLNLESMDSHLTYIDATSGKHIESFRVSEPKASIRHLDVANDGTVAIAIQVQRQACGHTNNVPLAAIHAPDKALELFESPLALIASMNDYVGSVAINNSTRIAGFTSPRGNLVAFWHIDSKEFVGYHRLRDVCGIAITPDQKHFILSSSIGELRHLDANTLKENLQQRMTLTGTQWDNHLLAITLKTNKR